MSQINLRYVPTLSCNEFILNGQRFNTQGANIAGNMTPALTTEVIINDATKNQALYANILNLEAEVGGNVNPNLVVVNQRLGALESNVAILQGNVVFLQNEINDINGNLSGLNANTQYLHAPYNGQGGSTSYFTNGLQVWNGANESGNGIFSYTDGSAPTNQIRLSVQNAKQIFLDGGNTLIAPSSAGSVSITGSGGTAPYLFNVQNPGLLNANIRMRGDIQLSGNGSSAISIYTEPAAILPLPHPAIDRVDIVSNNETRVFGQYIKLDDTNSGVVSVGSGSASVQCKNGSSINLQAVSGSSNSDIKIGTDQDILATGYTTITLGSGAPTALRNSSTFIEGDLYLPNNPATNTGLWDKLMYIGLPTLYSGPLHGPVKSTFNPYFRSISTFAADSTINSFVQSTGTFTVLVGLGAINLAAGAGGLTMTVGGGALAMTALAGGIVATTAGGAIQLTTGAGAINQTTGAGPIQLETNTGDILIHSGGAPGGVSGSTYITPKDYLIINPDKQVIIGENGNLPSYQSLIDTYYTYNLTGNVFNVEVVGNVSANVISSNVFQTTTQITYMRPTTNANIYIPSNFINPNLLSGNAFMTIYNKDTSSTLYTSSTTVITDDPRSVFSFGSSDLLLPASANLVAKVYPQGNISIYAYSTWSSNAAIASNIGALVNAKITPNAVNTTHYVNVFGNVYLEEDVDCTANIRVYSNVNLNQSLITDNSISTTGNIYADKYFGNVVYLANGTPANTTNALYNVSGNLYFNGSAVGGGGGGGGNIGNYVSQIIAGNGIAINPPTGIGNVVVSVAGSVVPPGGYLPIIGGQMNGDILMAGNAAIYQGVSGTQGKDQIKLYRPMSSYQAPFPNIGPPTYTGELLTFYNGDNNSPTQSVFTGWFPQSLFDFEPVAMTQPIPGPSGTSYNQPDTGTPQNPSYIANITLTITNGQRFTVGSVYLNQANTSLPLSLYFGAPDFTPLNTVNFAAGSFPSSGLFNFTMDITWNHGTQTYWKVWWEQSPQLLINCQNPSAQFNNNWCGSLGYTSDPFYVVAVPYLNQNQTVMFKWFEGQNNAEKLFTIDGTLNGIYEGQIGSSFLYFYGLFNNYIDASQTLRVNNLFQWNVSTGGVFKVLSESNLVQNEPVGTNGEVYGIEVDTANNRTWVYGLFDSYGTDMNGNPVSGANDVSLFCGCTFTTTDTWAIGPTVMWGGVRGFNLVKSGKLLDAAAGYSFLCWATERWDGSAFQPYGNLGITFYDGTNWVVNIGNECLANNDGIPTVVSNIQFINDFSGGGYKIFFTGTFSSATIGGIPSTPCYSITYTEGGGTFNTGTQLYQYGLNHCCDNQNAGFWLPTIAITNLRRMSNGVMIMNTGGYLVSGNGGGVMSFELEFISTPTQSPTKYPIANTISYNTKAIIGNDPAKVKLVASLNSNNFFFSQTMNSNPAPPPSDPTVIAINGAKFLVDNTPMDKIIFSGSNQDYSSVSFIAGKVEDDDFNWYWQAQVGALDYYSGATLYPNITSSPNVPGPTSDTLGAVMINGSIASTNLNMNNFDILNANTIYSANILTLNPINGVEVGVGTRREFNVAIETLNTGTLSGSNTFPSPSGIIASGSFVVLTTTTTITQIQIAVEYNDQSGGNSTMLVELIQNDTGVETVIFSVNQDIGFGLTTYNVVVSGVVLNPSPAKFYFVRLTVPTPTNSYYGTTSDGLTLWCVVSGTQLQSVADPVEYFNVYGNSFFQENVLVHSNITVEDPANEFFRTVVDFNQIQCISDAYNTQIGPGSTYITGGVNQQVQQATYLQLRRTDIVNQGTITQNALTFLQGANKTSTFSIAQCDINSTSGPVARGTLTAGQLVIDNSDTFPVFSFTRNAITPVSTVISQLSSFAKDAVGTTREWTRIQTQTENVAAGNQDGTLQIWNLVNGVLLQTFSFNGAQNENNSFRPLDLNGNDLRTTTGNLLLNATVSTGVGQVQIQTKPGVLGSGAGLQITGNTITSVSAGGSAGAHLCLTLPDPATGLPRVYKIALLNP